MAQCKKCKQDKRLFISGLCKECNISATMDRLEEIDKEYDNRYEVPMTEEKLRLLIQIEHERFINKYMVSKMVSSS